MREPTKEHLLHLVLAHVHHRVCACRRQHHRHLRNLDLSMRGRTLQVAREPRHQLYRPVGRRPGVVLLQRSEGGAIGIGGGLLYIYLIAFGPHHLIGPFVLCVVGIGTYITGRTLRFKPLVLGGFAFWAFMVASLFVADDWQFILGAAAMVPGYLIPGYMLRALYNRQNHAEEA